MATRNGYEINVKLDNMRSAEPDEFKGIIIGDKTWEKGKMEKAIIIDFK